MSRFETIELRHESGVATVTLNRPDKMNALNDAMLAELKSTFAELGQDDDVRAVVLTGKGRAFCAGGDVGQLSSGKLAVSTVKQSRALSRDLVLALRTFEKPLVCAVNGIAAGGGAGLVLACDVVFASTKASFSVIHRHIGMVPDCGVLYLLPHAVGASQAKRLSYTGEIIDADEMLHLGIATELVKDDALGRAQEFAHKCAEGPALALGLSKLLIDRASSMDIEAFFDLEALALPMAMESDDFKEGVDAFLGKREARFGKSQL